MFKNRTKVNIYDRRNLKNVFHEKDIDNDFKAKVRSQIKDMKITILIVLCILNYILSSYQKKPTLLLKFVQKTIARFPSIFVNIAKIVCQFLCLYYFSVQKSSFEY